MCGKFTQMASWEGVHTFSETLTATDGPAETVTPMRFASIVCLDESGNRQVKKMRWGFARRSATGPSARPDHIHARAETIDEKTTFRDAFREDRRGILVVKTFNEGKEIAPNRTEQHTVMPRDGKPMGIAVLYERWEHENGGELYTFVMVTVGANALISAITDRMPAVVQPGDWSKWLGEEPATVDELRAILVPFEGDWDMAPEKKTKPGTPVPGPNPQTDLF